MQGKRPFRKHCSDELLLGHVDGELSWFRQLRVRKHLQLCWECRSRLAELEGEAAALARAFADTSFLGPEGMERALRNLSRGVAAVEERLTDAPCLASMPAAPVRARVLAAAAVAVVVCMVVWGLHSARDERPRDLLAAAQGAEKVWGGAPLIHASLRVEVAEFKPAERRRVGRIEIWSEPSNRRSAVRWNDQQGTLRYAVWRPAEGRQYVFDSGAGQIAPAGVDREGTGWLTRIREAEPTLEGVEDAFLSWLASRQWHPLDLADNLAEFVDGGGLRLGAEKATRDDGTTAVRLLVVRPDARRKLEIVLEIDRGTKRPRFERVRLEAGGRAVEFSVTVDRVEAVSPRELQPGIFEPDAPPALPVALGKSQVPARVPPGSALRKAPLFDVERFDAAQVDADYVIHRAGACLGEPVEVLREAPDVVCVRGVMENNQHKSELLHEFSQLPSFALLRIDLQTLQDAVARPAFPGGVLPRETYTATRRLPLQDVLERAFGGQAEIAMFTNEAVSASDNLMAHAWALNHLASGYGHIAAKLPSEPRWLLEAMARDHLAGLHAAFLKLSRRCDPLFKLAPENQADPTASHASPDETWRGSLQMVFATSRQVDRLVQALATGAGLEHDPGDRVAGELQTELLRLDENLQRAEAVAKQGFYSESSAARSR